MASASCDSDLVYEGHHIERAPDRTGADRNAIVFELRSLEAIEEVVEVEGPPPGATLQELRQRAMTATASPYSRQRKACETFINAAEMCATTS